MLENDDEDDDGKAVASRKTHCIFFQWHYWTTRYYRFRYWYESMKETFGTPFLGLVATVYCVQGLKSFSKLALNYLLKDVLKLQPTSSQALIATAGIPWGIKPLYGIISDSFPLFGYRRRSYLFVCAVLSIVAHVGLSTKSGTSTAVTVTSLLLVTNLSTAVSDVVIDARVVEMSRLDPVNGANDLQSLSWSMMSMGGIIGSILAGPATDHLGPRMVFALAAIGPILILLFTIYMKEEPVVVSATKQRRHKNRHCWNTAREQSLLLFDSMKAPLVWKSAVWIFLSNAIAPGFHQISFYYMTDVLQFTPEFLGGIGAVGYLFLMLGTVVYHSWFRATPFRSMLYYAQIGLALVSLLDIVLVTRWNLKLGISDQWFVLGDEILTDVVSRLKSMPIFVLCAKLCPPGVEGSLFALLMSTSNCSRSISSYWGALLCYWMGIQKGHYEHLWLAVLVRSVLKLVPIFLLSCFIPDVCPQEEIVNQRKRNNNPQRSSMDDSLDDPQVDLETTVKSLQQK